MVFARIVDGRNVYEGVGGVQTRTISEDYNGQSGGGCKDCNEGRFLRSGGLPVL